MTKAGTTRKGKRLVFKQWALISDGKLINTYEQSEIPRARDIAEFINGEVVPCTVTVQVPAGKGKKK